jgi:hypothetical protein
MRIICKLYLQQANQCIVKLKGFYYSRYNNTLKIQNTTSIVITLGFHRFGKRFLGKCFIESVDSRASITIMPSFCLSSMLRVTYV